MSPTLVTGDPARADRAPAMHPTRRALRWCGRLIHGRRGAVGKVGAWGGALALAACASSAGPAAPVRGNGPPAAAAPVGAGASATATPPPPEGALPRMRVAATPRFGNAVVCARCHSASSSVFRDGKGRDVSPFGEWQVSMMGLAAREPYFLAAVERELADAGAAGPQVEALCWRCHAPAAHAEAQALGRALSLELVTSGGDDLAELARGGVDCVGCHGIDPQTLGTAASYAAGAPLRTDRVVYGALTAPRGEAMVAMAKTEPRFGEHVRQSALCGGCHTVLVPTRDERGLTGEVLAEQTTYLEWRSSAFAGQRARATGAAPGVETSCQDCHMPLLDDDGAPVISVFATRPPAGLEPRPAARHTLVGGSAYLLERLAELPEVLGVAASASELRAAAGRSRALLGRAAALRLVAGPRARTVTAVVQNLTGHKLPTGYPSRRMWLRVVVRDAAGATIWESGAHRDGALVDAAGARLDLPQVVFPHRTKLGGRDGLGPVVWEAVPVDARGQRTHLLTRAVRFVKDDRLLPLGFDPQAPQAALAAPAGVGADADFTAGSDSVTIALPPGAATVHAELLYQALTPEVFESYSPRAGVRARVLLQLGERPPVPEVLARAEWAAAWASAQVEGGEKP